MNKSTEKRLVGMLRRVPLFAGLSNEECARLAAQTREMECGRGTLLFSAGEPAKGMFVVMRGLVKIFQPLPDGREIIVHLVQPGQSFAEAAVLQRASYPACATAVIDSHLLFLPGPHLLAEITRQPELALRMLASLSNRLREFARTLNEQQRGSARARLAAWLRNQTGTGREVSELRLDFSREILASILGITRETLSRTLSAMQEAGVLSVHGKNIAILDRARLEKIADGKEEI